MSRASRRSGPVSATRPMAQPARSAQHSTPAGLPRQARSVAVRVPARQTGRPDGPERFSGGLLALAGTACSPLRTVRSRIRPRYATADERRSEPGRGRGRGLLADRPSDGQPLDQPRRSGLRGFEPAHGPSAFPAGSSWTSVDRTDRGGMVPAGWSASGWPGPARPVWRPRSTGCSGTPDSGFCPAPSPVTGRRRSSPGRSGTCPRLRWPAGALSRLVR